MVLIPVPPIHQLSKENISTANILRMTLVHFKPDTFTAGHVLAHEILSHLTQGAELASANALRISFQVKYIAKYYRQP